MTRDTKNLAGVLHIMVYKHGKPFIIYVRTWHIMYGREYSTGLHTLCTYIKWLIERQIDIQRAQGKKKKGLGK